MISANGWQATDGAYPDLAPVSADKISFGTTAELMSVMSITS